MVSLRQLERQHQRDKDRQTEYTQTLEESYVQKLEKQHKQIVALTQERNIMKVSGNAGGGRTGAGGYPVDVGGVDIGHRY